MSIRSCRQTFLAAVLVLIVLSFPLGATTIISTDLGSAGYTELFGGFAADVAWTQTGTFSGATVYAEIDPGGNGTTPSTETGTAYLTTQIGPGTTVADEIASTSFSVTGLAFDPTDDPLFTGLTLGPGTYYLVLTATGSQPGGWEITSTGITPVTAPGVTDIDLGHQGTGTASYPPALSFSLVNGNPLEFSVTGTSSATPEPSTLPLVCATLRVLVLITSLTGYRNRDWVTHRAK